MFPIRLYSQLQCFPPRNSRTPLKVRKNSDTFFASRVRSFDLVIAKVCIIHQSVPNHESWTVITYKVVNKYLYKYKCNVYGRKRASHVLIQHFFLFIVYFTIGSEWRFCLGVIIYNTIAGCNYNRSGQTFLCLHNYYYTRPRVTAVNSSSNGSDCFCFITLHLLYLLFATIPHVTHIPIPNNVSICMWNYRVDIIASLRKWTLKHVIFKCIYAQIYFLYL